MGVRRVLTIAGSDSGGGAGIQADLRTFALLGCHGACAITAITVQNSLGAQSIYPVPPEVVEAQLESVLSDLGSDAGKTGMLVSAEIVQAVARGLARHPVERLVVDPVMTAKGGATLLNDDAREALIREILPLACLVTPNLPEAEALIGAQIRDEEDKRDACARILELGPQAVLLKGGHASGDRVTDLYADQSGQWESLSAARQATPHTHGTGCTLSAAIAAFLAQGCDTFEAVREAHRFLQIAIQENYPMGAGHGCVNPMAAAGFCRRRGAEGEHS